MSARPARAAARRALAPLLALLLAASLLAPLAACDSDDGGGGTDQALSLALTWDPAPPTTGQNRLTVVVTDAGGAPVTGAAVTVDPQMPSMGHGSSETAVVTEVDAGAYEAFPVTFQMPGEWTVTVTASHGGMTGTKTASMNVGGSMGGM